MLCYVFKRAVLSIVRLRHVDICFYFKRLLYQILHSYVK